MLLFEAVAESTQIVVVYVTCPERDGGRIARTLVERRLAACVNLIPGVRSVYRWEGAIEEAVESLLVIKTDRDRLEALRAGVVEVHPYDVPEVIALPVVAGHEPYLAWVKRMSGEEG